METCYTKHVFTIKSADLHPIAYAIGGNAESCYSRAETPSLNHIPII